MSTLAKPSKEFTLKEISEQTAESGHKRPICEEIITEAAHGYDLGQNRFIGVILLSNTFSNLNHMKIGIQSHTKKKMYAEYLQINSLICKQVIKYKYYEL